MQVPTEMKKSRACVFVFLLPVVLVLSGCGGGSIPPITPLHPAPAASINISVSPSAVLPGQSATLTWSSQNALACTGSGSWSGVQANSGSATVVLQAPQTQTYTLSCTSAGEWAQRTVTLAMSPADGACTVNGAAVPRAQKRAARRMRVTGSPS
jgi:hypothetical protein